MLRNALTRAAVLLMFIAVIVAVSTRLRADSGDCGGQMISVPFTDVAGNFFFCQIAAAYFSGLTNGTSATTYSPTAAVTREQMAAFITRTQDSALRRGSRRAALGQWWTTKIIALTSVGAFPSFVQSDGADLWVANNGFWTVSRIRASDGRVLETWTGATNAHGVVVAAGRVFVTGLTLPGSLYQIDPTQPAGNVTILSTALGDDPFGIAYDGERIWTANQGGSVSIVTLNPVTVTNVTTGFTEPTGIVYDGTNIWVTDNVAGLVDKLHKLDSSGNILMSVDVDASPHIPAFDGTNIWVPNKSSSTVTVIRATGALSGTVLATLNGNGLAAPFQAAFDGERILVTNVEIPGVSLWRAADFSPITTLPVSGEGGAFGACSDGLNFWFTLNNPGKLARF